MSRTLKCLERELGGRQYGTMPVGPRVVKVDRIIGSLDKCDELRRNFRPRGIGHRLERHRRARLDRLFADLHAATSLPPINVYMYRGEYYVVDGHRRVASAITAGREFMDAHVTEVVLLEDRRSRQGALSRRAFEQQTGLVNVRLANEAGYDLLLDEIQRQIGDGSLRGWSRKWYSEQYLPACKAIEAAGLPELFPGMRVGDLFVMILRFHRQFDSGFPRSGGFQDILSRFLAARTRCRFRLGGCSLCRALARLFQAAAARRRGPF